MNPDPSTPPSPTEPRTLPDRVDRVAASVVGLAMRGGSASGVVWTPGVAVTAACAVRRAHRLQVVLPDGECAAADLRGIDAATDLAAVAFTAPSVPAAERAATAAPRVGDFVFAAGREPSGRAHASFGHVGAAGGPWRTWRGGAVERLIRLDGGLYPGLAGAPVADAAGLVLGVASPALSRHHGVVLPVGTIDRVLAQLLAHGRVQKGYLGIAAQPVRATLEGSAVDGLLVSSVAPDGPAAAAGLMVGDVIVGVNDQPVTSIETLRDRVDAEQIGGRIRLKVARGGQATELSVDVAEWPERRGCH